MAGQRILSRSTRLLRARRFAEVISLLEPQVFLFRENATFYYNLGVACLYVGDFGGAMSYLQRARQLTAEDTNVLLGLAAVHLRRRQAGEALRCWLEVLDRDPRNTTAKRGLALVRTTTDPSVYVTMAESGKLRRFYPDLGFRLPRWLIPAAAVAVVAVIVTLVWPILIELANRPDVPPREGFEFTEIDGEEGDLTDFSADFRYVLTEKEIEQTFVRVGDYFNDFRDNLARREVNRLLNSNASQAVKERALLVASYFSVPTFVDFKDNFTFAEVAREPWLYDGCYVKWSGRASNVAASQQEIRFTLLVGYEQERVLEGTIEVTVAFAADVQAGPIELIGQLHFSGGRLTMTATSIRRIAERGGA